MLLEKPIIFLDKAYLDLNEDEMLKIKLKNMSKEYFLVIDAYPVENPKHPDRHLGWYRYDDLKDDTYIFKLKIENRFEIQSDNNLLISDSWILDKSALKDMFPISLKIVIRKKINNEIVSENKLLVFKEENYLEICKKRFEEFNGDFDKLLPIKYILPHLLEVKIVLKSFTDKDAIGYFVKQIYALLTRHNIEVTIYAQYIDDYFRPFVHTIDELLEEKTLNGDSIVLLYNYSIEDEYIDEIIKLPYKKIVYYHGITEPSKIKVFDALLARECQKGIDNLYKLCLFDKIISNSKKTKIELLNIVKEHLKENIDIDPEYEKTLSNKKSINLRKKLIKKSLKRIKLIEKKCTYLPPTVIQKRLWENIDSDGQFEKSLLELGNIILFVGRIFPHKKVEEVIEIFKEYLKLDKKAILILVGGGHNSYQKYLQYKIEQLSKKEKERIIFMHGISVNQLKATYKAAKVFITMSEDEGFCVPILEAMNFCVPVIAKLSKGTACEEILGDSGKIIINSIDYESIAREIYNLNFDEVYRESVIEKQNKQLCKFDDDILSEKFLNAIMECYYAHKSNV